MAVIIWVHAFSHGISSNLLGFRLTLWKQLTKHLKTWLLHLVCSVLAMTLICHSIWLLHRATAQNKLHPIKMIWRTSEETRNSATFSRGNVLGKALDIQRDTSGIYLNENFHNTRSAFVKISWHI